MAPLKDTVKSVGRRRWIVSFILVGVGIAATFLLITYFFPGNTFLDRLEASYRFLWEHTSRRQFTDIMRSIGFLLFRCGWNFLLTLSDLLVLFFTHFYILTTCAGRFKVFSMLSTILNVVTSNPTFYITDEIESIDIDTEFDFMVAEFVYEKMYG